MRWIFFSLVFGNLLLLVVLWQQQNTPVQAAPVVSLAGGGRSLLLVSEAGDILQPLEKRPAVQAQGRDGLCYSAGPYMDELDARHLLARVSAVGLNGRIKDVEIETGEPAEYWVHVPPRASREEALRVLKELQKRNLDSYIITQGELAEGVSLGLFRNKDSAYDLQRKVAGFDLPVDVLVVNHSRREYWVEVVEASQLNERMRERIQAGDEHISWELTSCEAR